MRENLDILKKNRKKGITISDLLSKKMDFKPLAIEERV
jgi:hypothetical protein